MEWLNAYLKSFSAADYGVDEDVGTWIKHGLLPYFRAGESHVASISQLHRMQLLSAQPFSWDSLPAVPDLLFSPSVACTLGPRSCVVEGDLSKATIGEDPVLLQLLPIWASAASTEQTRLPSWEQIDFPGLRLYTLDSGLWGKYQEAAERAKVLSSARAGTFARSAYYMGSKAALAPQLCEIVHAFETPSTCLVDLMCGSGAMSGAFARNWRTIASDAQTFSRLLARVQGGGMTRHAATGAANTVLARARIKFEQMPESLRNQIRIEDEFIHSELTSSKLSDLVQWLRDSDTEWQQVGSPSGRSSKWHDRYTLFSSLYANLFFGFRQAYEIDCLRYGVDSLEDPVIKEWALGALICATSACAFSYGGHFAQPKLDISSDEKILSVAAEMLQQRALSVSHEFYVRFISLAEESASVPNAIETVVGPWEKALSQIESRTQGQKVCAYIDPPYTRDEYSRYYHVLETLTHYDCPPVTGKARIPARGSANRFASAFNSRLPEAVERHIALILTACLDRGWSCMWSYSDSGLASIRGVLQKLGAKPGDIEIFGMEHMYKAQGKRGAKKVLEHAIYLGA